MDEKFIGEVLKATTVSGGVFEAFETDEGSFATSHALESVVGDK